MNVSGVLHYVNNNTICVTGVSALSIVTHGKKDMGIPNNEEPKSRKHKPQIKYLTNLGSLTYSYKQHMQIQFCPVFSSKAVVLTDATLPTMT